MRTLLRRTAAAAACATTTALLAPAAAWQFTEVSAQAGIAYEHGYQGISLKEPHRIAGGIAAADYDGDGFADLYAVRGNIGPNLLFRNRGDGSFEEVGAAAGVAIEGAFGSGPTFADWTGDGFPDLFIGGVEGTAPRLFENLGDGTFTEVTAASGISFPPTRHTFSAAFGDYDLDGDLDLALAHWAPFGGGTGHLWRNQGDGTFVDADAEAGIADAWRFEDFSFSPAFADLDGDGFPDLLMASDFGTSRYFLNRQDGTFEEATNPAVVTDENGMGSAVADYDGDGDLDWFVSSIWDPDGVANGNWGVTGNRLYRNQGDGTFEDATDDAGVRRGYWGWGSCFADFDNDAHLDLFHTNGFSVAGATEYHFDPSRLFVSAGDGTFAEQAAALGVVDTGQGRGIACFDFDHDGDLDVLVANNSGPVRLYRNDLATGARSLTVKLRGEGATTEALGARVWATVGGATQMREIGINSNFASHDPAEAHFGLGTAARVEELRVRWPDGEETVLTDLPAGGVLELDQRLLGSAPAIPALSGAGLAALVLLVAAAGWTLLRRSRGH